MSQDHGMKPALVVAAAASLLLSHLAMAAGPVRDAAVTDPVPDAAHPTANKQVLVPSAGVGMNGLFLLASGAGPKPTVVLLHGLPGNERNLDLAQAMRRAGWSVLAFTYRGAWGSPGEFSIAHALEDTAAAMAFVHDPAVAARYGIDRTRIVIAGHSMGGFAAAQYAAGHDDIAGVLLLDAWNIGADARTCCLTPGKRAETVAGFDDLGHALAGADAESLTREVEESPPGWDLLTLAPKLARHRVLTVWADRGIAADNAALAEAMRKAGASRLASAHLPTDHPFSDHRIALARTVVGWLDGLR